MHMGKMMCHNNKVKNVVYTLHHESQKNWVYICSMLRDDIFIFN